MNIKQKNCFKKYAKSFGTSALEGAKIGVCIGAAILVARVIASAGPRQD